MRRPDNRMRWAVDTSAFVSALIAVVFPTGVPGIFVRTCRHVPGH